MAKNETLENYSGFVEDSGEGRWTINAAIDEAVPAEVITAALYARFRSRKDHTFAEKISPPCVMASAATPNRRSSADLRARKLWNKQ